MSFTCPICSIQYEKLISLSLHYRKTHKKTAQELYVALNCSGVEPTCKCGCGESTRFMDITRGFSDYKVGHVSRIKNNFLTEKSRTNSIKTRRKMLESGEWKPFVNEETGKHWKNGLTSETDIRVAKQRAAILANPEEIKRRSEMMKECWKDGRIQVKLGSESSQWKGGISSLANVARNNKRLYEEWKRPLLLAAGFRCISCNSTHDLHVHHDKETFSNILRKKAVEYGWNDNLATKLQDDENHPLKLEISEAVTDYHIQNNVSGVVFCKVCHSSLHDKLNSDPSI